MHHSRSVARRFFDVVARASDGDNITISMDDIRQSVFVDLDGNGTDSGNEVIYTKKCMRKSKFTGRMYVDRTFKSETQYNELQQGEQRDWSRYMDDSGNLVTEASIVTKNLGVWSTFYETATADDSLKGTLISFDEFWELLCEFELASLHEQGPRAN